MTVIVCDCMQDWRTRFQFWLLISCFLSVSIFRVLGIKEGHSRVKESSRSFSFHSIHQNRFSFRHRNSRAERWSDRSNQNGKMKKIRHHHLTVGSLRWRWSCRFPSSSSSCNFFTFLNWTGRVISSRNSVCQSKLETHNYCIMLFNCITFVSRTKCSQKSIKTGSYKTSFSQRRRRP